AEAMTGAALTWVWVSAAWLIVIGGLIAGVAWLLTRRVVAPLVALTGTVGALAKGELAVEVPGRDRKDELGEMAQAIGVLRDRALEGGRLSEEAAAAQAARDARAQKMEQLTAAFEADATKVARDVAQATDTMRAQATTAADLTARIAGDAQAAASASDEASAN